MKQIFFALIFLIIPFNGIAQKSTWWGEILKEVSTQQSNNSKKTSKSNIVFEFRNYYADDEKLAKYLQASSFLKETEKFIENTIKLNNQLKITFIDSPKIGDNAYFDPSTNSITITYSIIKRNASKTYQNFKSVDYTQAIHGVLLQIMFHEMAHYLIANYNLNITGKEENAADQLSIMAMLYIAQVQPSLGVAVKYGILGWYEPPIYKQKFDVNCLCYKNYKVNTVDNRSLVDEHAPNMERYYDMLSLFCGSNISKAYSDNLIGENEFQIDINRARRSEREYKIAYESWTELMSQFFN